MPLEQQVCSVEWSKKLKELGVEQGGWESVSPLFYWSTYDDGFSKENPGLIPAEKANFGFMESLYAAFTVAELGEMLPKGITVYCTNITGKWGWKSFYVVHAAISTPDTFDTEADARAKMLIYLLENKLITI